MESNRLEYKRELTDQLEKEVVAFLNYRDGGVIYLGIDDKTHEVIGIDQSDELQLKIKDRLKHNILPSCLGLFDVILEERDNKTIIKITIAGGSEKPYYIKKYGMSEKGCFIRIGSSSEPIPVRLIEEMFTKRARNTIGYMHSPKSDLSFEQLKIYYLEAGYQLNDKFLSNLELLTQDNHYNYAAYLLSDNNGISIKIAKYADTTQINLVESKEYGYCSLIKAVKAVLDRLEIENTIFTKITYKKRLERRLVDETALKEAVVNAIIHNDYSFSAPPKFELFSDRIEITSLGGIPSGVSTHEFFSGLSVPRNKELMRVFKDLELVEYLGSGIPRILAKYDQSVFHISDNFIRVTFPFNKGFNEEMPLDENTTVATVVETVPISVESVLIEEENVSIMVETVETVVKILSLLKDNPNLAAKELAKKTGLSIRGVEWHLAKLKVDGKLRRIGTTKRGFWKVSDENIITVETVVETVETVVEIINLIKNNPKITVKILSHKTGISVRGVEWHLRKLKNEGKIKREGPNKGGHWVVIDE